MKMFWATMNLTLAIFGMLTLSGEAFPAMFSLEGSPGEPGGAVTEATDVLYATNRAGQEVELARVGAWRGLDVRDLGLPFVSDDGTVLFAAAILRQAGLRWQLFAASPDRGTLRTIELPESLEMRADPRPIAGADGSVIFSVTDPIEALYRLDHGKLVCLLKAGQRLPDGHLVHMISLGSIDVSDGNVIALIAFLGRGKEAELMLSRNRVSIVATEGGRTPDGGLFLRLGDPTIGQKNREASLIFTARTTHGYNLYEFSRRRLRPVLSAGASCPDGPLTFLSEEKAVFDNGGIVVEAACSGHPRRLLIRPDRGIVNDDFQPPTAARPIVDAALEPSHSVEDTTISVNRRGQAAYLGSPRSLAGRK